MMRKGLIVLALSAVFTTHANAACDGRVVTKTGRNGKTLQLCFDGKYSTCLRDSQRLGWAYGQAKSFCDERKAAGAVK
jgi:hypothetical protein